MPRPTSPRRPLRRRVGRLLGTLVVLTATLVGLVVVVPSLLGFHLYAITTGSMAGTIDPGALAVAREVPVTDLAEGDVITYVPPPDTGIAHLVTHRIVDIADVEGVGTTFTTRGDANQSDDPWTFQLTAPTQARVEASVPLLGRPVLWLRDPGNRFIAIGVPALLIAALSLRELFQVLRPARDRGAEEDSTLDAPDTLVVVPEPNWDLEIDLDLDIDLEIDLDGPVTRFTSEGFVARPQP